jgi:hypothetical protein
MAFSREMRENTKWDLILIWGKSCNLFPQIISALYVEFVQNECIEEDVNITSFVFVMTLFSYMEQNMIYILFKATFVTL